MWRSKARAFTSLIRCASREAPSIPNQVLTETPTVIRSPLPHLSVSLFQNPRFFSNEAIPNDQNPIFDENPDFLSQESHLSSSTLDENPSFSLEEGIDGENPSFGSQDENFEGENVSLSLQEEGIEGDGNEEEMGSFVLEEERAVAEEASEIDVEQVERVLSVLQSSLDGTLESSLDTMELNVHEEFMVRIIETPLVPGESLIAFLRWALKKPEFSVTTPVVDCLVRAINSGRRIREAYHLWDLVKEIGEKPTGVLNTQILNELISLFSKLGKGKAALEVFNKFEELGCAPNADSYYFTIEALCRRSFFDWAWPVCEKMLNAGSLPDSEKVGKIIEWLCRGRKVKDAHLVYLMAKEKNRSPPRSKIDFLIQSLCKEDDTVKLALELLEDYEGDARKHAIKPFSSVVCGLCRIKETEEAKKLLHKMIQEGPPPGNGVFNAVINGLSKAGEMEGVMDLVKVMESRGLRPDVYTYTVIMSGYAKGGQMEEARKILSEAKKKHSSLHYATYHTLIRGYCKLEEFDKALELLNEMKESGVQPNTDEYNKMIQSLCLKALDWRTAEKLFEEMKEKGLHLNGLTRSLIRAVKEMEEQELNAEGVSVEE